MAKKPHVYVLYPSPDGYDVAKYDPDDYTKRDSPIVGHYVPGSDISGEIYSWTQSGWLGDEEIPMPIGSVIVVKKRMGTPAVIVLYSAWPVLLTGSLPGDDTLHRFEEP